MSENRSGEWKDISTPQSSQQLNNTEISMSRAEKHSRSNDSSYFSRGNKESKDSIESAQVMEEQAIDDATKLESKRASAPLWARSLFWILRKSIAPIIMIVMLLAGLYIGYVIMGGQSKDEVFQLSTYKHLWDLIFAES